MLGRRLRPEVGADPDHRPGRALQANDVAQGVASVRIKYGVRPAVEVALEFLLLGGFIGGVSMPGVTDKVTGAARRSKWSIRGGSIPAGAGRCRGGFF